MSTDKNECCGLRRFSMTLSGPELINASFNLGDLTRQLNLKIKRHSFRTRLPATLMLLTVLR
ncbi:MAG: hypothetical protein A2Z83_00715 [Omnitrophica bacterium GWA2_52_8]|nr:MAG: hypothetical protein A2Z83_00715 [Omnitrophica bacterium GWA2_52_8]